MNTSEALASPTAISRFHVAVALRVPLFPMLLGWSRGRRARDRLRAARRPALDGTAPIRDTPLGAAIRPRRSPPTLSNRHHLNRRVWRTWGPALFLFADALASGAHSLATSPDATVTRTLAYRATRLSIIAPTRL